eukprot:TRINITY_DN7052_c0_g1_i4.p1 TRINITY_DN7052_c0_g1~~TRINITY_DN7052_c0_g1_i4.p1  ORF type:complete len:126 (+),score=13.11 TRINITY_DN7052_c0_g1_i4:64-441(+)
MCIRDRFSHKWFSFFIWIGLVCGVGIFGLQVFLSRLMDPLIISVVQYFKLIVSGVLVWFLGIQSLPGFFTWLGSFILIPGVIMITIAQAQHAAHSHHDHLEAETEMQKLPEEPDRPKPKEYYSVI